METKIHIEFSKFNQLNICCKTWCSRVLQKLGKGRKMHIDHINISAPKELLEKVKDFYCAIFDLVDGHRPSFSTPGFWLYAGDNAIIHLIESSVHYRNEKQGYLDHVAYRATGLKEMVNKLNAMKVEYTLNFRPELHMTQVFFKDPAGVGVEAKFINEVI